MSWVWTRRGQYLVCLGRKCSEMFECFQEHGSDRLQDPEDQQSGPAGGATEQKPVKPVGKKKKIIPHYITSCSCKKHTSTFNTKTNCWHVGCRLALARLPLFLLFLIAATAVMRSLSTRDVFFSPAGTEFVRPVVAYFCNLCQLIYADEDEAKIQHCSSPMHYRKYQVRVELPDRVQEVTGESWSQLTVTESTLFCRRRQAKIHRRAELLKWSNKPGKDWNSLIGWCIYSGLSWNRIALKFGLHHLMSLFSSYPNLEQVHSLNAVLFY